MRKHNLKRIYRIRFTSIRIFFGFPENGQNASRSLTPKKIHTGYLVLSSRQWIEHYPHDLSPEEYQAMPDSFKQTHSFHVQNTVLHMYGNPSCRLLTCQSSAFLHTDSHWRKWFVGNWYLGSSWLSSDEQLRNKWCLFRLWRHKQAGMQWFVSLGIHRKL